MNWETFKPNKINIVITSIILLLTIIIFYFYQTGIKECITAACGNFPGCPPPVCYGMNLLTLLGFNISIILMIVVTLVSYFLLSIIYAKSKKSKF